MRDVKEQQKPSPVQQNNPEADPEENRKIFSQAYPALLAFAKALQNQTNISRPIQKRRATKTELPKHLDRAIITAETYSERDLLCRRLSSYCYNLSKWFMNKQDYKQAIKWMTLSLNFLHLSMDPKKLQMDEKFEAELDELEKKVEEEKRQRELSGTPQS